MDTAGGNNDSYCVSGVSVELSCVVVLRGCLACSRVCVWVQGSPFVGLRLVGRSRVRIELGLMRAERGVIRADLGVSRA